jgi:large subunit ribosomal protein L5
MTTTKPRLQTIYEEKVVPVLREELGITNAMACPKMTKVTLNVGLKQGLKDPKFVDHAEAIITKIAGQKPIRTIAKKSISNFKIREGNIVGLAVTLRGRRMYDFIDKFVNVTLPRVRDFRGISAKGIDHAGNMTVGFREFTAFPEVTPEDTDYLHGLEVTFVNTASTKVQGQALFRALGFPFKVNEK